MKIIALLLLLAVSAGAAPGKPNILIIVSDDQGYADVGFHGSKQAVTPHLDKLAASGVRCTSGYVTYPVCSPSRAGLLTGRYQARFGHENNPVYDPLDPAEGLPLTERLLPEFLQAAGYRTGWIGKWHLGSAPAFVPWVRGFDETYGFIGGGHRYTGWQTNGRQYTLPLVHAGTNAGTVPPHLTEAFGGEAAAFIRRNNEKPWMLYLAFNAPHTPHEPTAERLEKFAHIQNPQRRRYLAQVSLLDDAIGAVTGALAESGQTKRTLVFFFSDNGGHTPSGSSNGALRGMKGTLYEGGIRVPFLVSWPDRLPAGKSYDQPVISLDAFATALAAAGVPMPADKKYDSVNIVPHLAGDVATPPHERLLWRLRAKDFAVREGAWKLIEPDGKPAELYDLASDLAEKNNLAAEKPDLTKRLAVTLAGWRKELKPPVFPGSSVKNEDWGPGGANQRNNTNAARLRGAIQRETRDISGWQVHINKKLLETESEDTARALAGLKKMLEEIVRVVPAPAVTELRKVPLYFSTSYKAGRSGAEFHPDAGWLRDNGRDPAMAHGVEFSGVHDFEAEMRRMPNFALHELAHAYHDRALAEGFANAEIKAAYERAKAGGTYERVERSFGEGNGRPNTFERAYAITSPMEYFAETTEAYFTRNDFFPFTRDELKKHDPEMFKLLEKLWGVPATK